MKHNTEITSGVAETAALGVDGPQPVWMTLNQARERAFTGEIVFETDPEVHAYLDNGIVYYAERASDASLGRRLLEAGVVDIDQLERGTVRVGDIEHLGRLFDRDPSVDRHAVIVLAETATEDLVAELANRSTAAVRATAYRHHPSGVHRWFVTQVEPAPMARPASTVAHYESTVIDGLPSLPFADNDAAELIIEWDMELGHPTELRADVFDLSLDFTEYTGDPRDDDDHAAVDTVGDVNASAVDDLYIETDDDLYIEPVDYIETIDDLHVEMADGLYVETVDDLPVETLDDLRESDTEEESAEEFEFSVVWPDGSEEPATRPVASEEPTTSPNGPSDVEHIELPLFTQSGNGHREFALPPLTLNDEPDLADAEVPDDVADAVRRAIAAIESATVVAPESLLRSEDSPRSDAADVEFVDEIDQPDTTDTPTGGFAPPTMDMRAEVLYGQTGADVRAVARSASPADESLAVFVDDPSDDPSADPTDDLADGESGGGDERRSALRRLIGSLRRKDH